MIIILTQDLMMSSSASTVARQCNVTLKSLASMSKALALIEAEDVSLILIDLQMPKLDVADAGAQLQTLSGARRPHCLAYAQHVNVDLLRTAKESGFDEVLTRGQLNSGLPALLNQYAN